MTVFPRSFLFSNQPLKDSSALSEVETPAGHLRVAPDTMVHVTRGGSGPADSFLILVGYAIDLDDTARSSAEIADGLLRKAVEQGFEAMLDGTYALLGRFTVICRAGGRWVVFADACGTRSSFYDRDEGRFWVSSHSDLIATEANRASIAWLLVNSKFGRPGDLSPYEGVRALLPNFCVDPSGNARPARFWPRRQRPTASMEEAYPRLERLLRLGAEAIGARWRPAVSLTAGLDSRVSFAAFKDNREAVFFTYDRGSPDAVDLSVARILCSRFETAHKRLDVPERDDPEVEAVAARLSDYVHIAAILPVFKRHFAGSGWMHVRSNLSEIGRTFWRRTTKTKEFTAQGIDALSRRDMNVDATLSAAIRNLRRRAFTEMVDMLGYDASDPANPRLKGYDGWDLFYWEHRMGRWHSALLLGTDFGLDTAILFNSRIVLDTLLSVDFAARRSSLLLRQFVRTNLRGADDIPTNPGYPLRVD